jgi:hypothetical protein
VVRLAVVRSPERLVEIWSRLWNVSLAAEWGLLRFVHATWGCPPSPLLSVWPTPSHWPCAVGLSASWQNHKSRAGQVKSTDSAPDQISVLVQIW